MEASRLRDSIRCHGGLAFAAPLKTRDETESSDFAPPAEIYMLTLILLCSTLGTEAAILLPSAYNNLVPTGRGGSIATPAATFQAVLTGMEQHADTWATAAGSTSHDIRTGLLRILTANVPV